jgi:hypothetical protein
MLRWRNLVLLLPLAACTPDYPMDKAGTWHAPEVGANDKNLRIMLVNPQDLIAGTGEDNSLGSESAPPVHRLLTGNRTPLPASDAAEFQSGGSPTGGSPIPGAPGGGNGAPAQ